MQTNVNTNIERIIAKIDNDFNPDVSDWIPRVGAWAIDAMSQLDVLRTKKIKTKVAVSDRIAYSNCNINNTDIKVYDENGCEVVEADSEKAYNGCSPTGKFASETSNSTTAVTPNTVNAVETGVKQSSNYVIAETVNGDSPYRYNVKEYTLGYEPIKVKTYTIVDSNKLELNFDASYITIETEGVETCCSALYGCELPVIPNNGLLIEAIAYYCMYKMLCRGYKHPVFNLSASQYGTNPYYIWNTLKEEARRSVINNNVDEESKLFRSNLFINTFDPRQ